jgi:hypothetical protein
VYRLKLMILLALFAVTPLWAQDDAPEPEQAEQADQTDQTEEEALSPTDKITDEEIDELLGLDEDYTEAEDDDFEASEKVRFAQSIPFPTDI